LPSTADNKNINPNRKNSNNIETIDPKISLGGIND